MRSNWPPRRIALRFGGHPQLRANSRVHRALPSVVRTLGLGSPEKPRPALFTDRDEPSHQLRAAELVMAVEEEYLGKLPGKAANSVGIKAWC